MTITAAFAPRNNANNKAGRARAILLSNGEVVVAHCESRRAGFTGQRVTVREWVVLLGHKGGLYEIARMTQASLLKTINRFLSTGRVEGGTLIRNILVSL